MSIQQSESELTWVLNTHTVTHSVIHRTITHPSLTAYVITVRFRLLDLYIPCIEVFADDRRSRICLSSLRSLFGYYHFYPIWKFQNMQGYWWRNISLYVDKCFGDVIASLHNKYANRLPLRERFSPHSTGSSEGVTFLSSGHWRHLRRENGWSYVFSHDISFEYFDLMFSAMISPLSFFLTICF